MSKISTDEKRREEASELWEGLFGDSLIAKSSNGHNVVQYQQFIDILSEYFMNVNEEIDSVDIDTGDVNDNSELDEILGGRPKHYHGDDGCHSFCTTYHYDKQKVALLKWRDAAIVSVLDEVNETLVTPNDDSIIPKYVLDVEAYEAIRSRYE